MKHLVTIGLLIGLYAGMLTAAPSGATPAAAPADDEKSYRIDQPGTITFTVGITIKGKVEKPQVMIFLPKERPYYKPIDYAHSFTTDILEPLPFVPLAE